MKRDYHGGAEALRESRKDLLLSSRMITRPERTGRQSFDPRELESYAEYLQDLK